MRILYVVSLLLFCLAPHFGFGQTSTEISALQLGQTVDRELAGGQKHTFKVDLMENQYGKIVVEQDGMEVVVQQIDTAGKVLVKYNAEPQNSNQFIAEIASQTGGSFLLTVECAQKTAPQGQYEIRLEETRPATEKDLALDEARKLFTEVNSLWRANSFGKAIPLAERVVEIQTKYSGSDSLGLSSALFALANQYSGMGEGEKAEPLFLRALEIREKALGKDDISLTGILANLTILYGDSGDYARAEWAAQRALEIREKAFEPNSPLIASSLTNLAIVNHLKGDDVKAAAYYQRALEIREKVLGPDSPEVAAALNNLAGVYSDSSKAEPLYSKALAIAEKALGPDHQYTGQIIYNSAVLYDRMGYYAKAKLLGQRALSIYEKTFGPEHPNIAFPLDLLGTIYKDTGEYDKAEQSYLRAIAIREKKQGAYHPNLGKTLSNLAHLYDLKGQINKAIETQTRANAILEYNVSINLVSGSERQKLGYLSMLSGAENQTLRISLGKAPDSPAAARLAITNILERKGRVLDVMSDSLGALRRRLDLQDKALMDRLADTSKQLASFVLDGRGGLSADEYQKKIDSFQQQRENLETQISSRSAGFFEHTEPVTLEAVKAAIPKDTALIEFAVYKPFLPKGPEAAAVESADKAPPESHYAAYVVRAMGEVKGIDIGEVNEVDEVLAAYQRALRDPKSKDVRQVARAADEKVIQPIRSLLGNSKHLLISPEGDLNLIPFEALVSRQGHYLVENYSVSYLTSGRDLLRMKASRASKSPPLLIANPSFGVPNAEVAKVVARRGRSDASSRKDTAKVPKNNTSVRSLVDAYFAPLGGTAAEARSIQSMFPNARLLIGAEANETSLKQATAPSILHIATHGFFIDGSENAADAASGNRNVAINSPLENPLLRSGLALSGANRRSSGSEDGILTALEASGLDLWGTKLVVLSACDTGIGEVKRGEGVYGLRRAFVQAGAESLVMSLWPVSDIFTKDLMINYYKNLKQGMGRGEALRQEQLELLKRSDRQHPFYWASFIQAGEWANLDGRR